MKILSIETSADETAIGIVEVGGELDSAVFNVLGQALFSQIDIHKQYGGIFPALAKREHAKNLPVLLNKVFEESGLYKKTNTTYLDRVWDEIKIILERENNLYDDFRNLFSKIEKPDIDVIAVTNGPGLAPALWVGITFAKALSKLWNIPVIGVNHMEGHIASILIENDNIEPVEFPALALLISGGHTELVKIESWGNYQVIGSTKDDAVGEAMDKAARMLGLPYPGGPEISRLAEKARTENVPKKTSLPRPMIYSKDLNFSFSGLKTAVLYYMRDNFSPDNPISENNKADISREFENAVIDVLVHKTKTAIEETAPKTLIIAGGVIGNKKIREEFMKFEKEYDGLSVRIPTKNLSTDNALMIAAACYVNICVNPNLIKSEGNIIAIGNLKLGIQNLN